MSYHYLGCPDFKVAKKHCPSLPVKPQPVAPPQRIWGERYGPRQRKSED